MTMPSPPSPCPMSPGRRTKSGCWTCRLRRKKCLEGGPPCINCAAQDIHCHGYGPKPSWKDRGDREREEANRLQLSTRRRRSSTASMPSRLSTATPCSPLNNPADVDVIETILPSLQNSLSFPTLPSPPQDHAFEFHFFDQPLSLASPSFLTCTDDDAWLLPATLDPLAELAASNVRAPETPLAFPSAAVPDLEFGLALGWQGPQFPEQDASLVMHFLLDPWPSMQHSSSRTSSRQSSWLLSLLMRSPTFYHASLSMSAYHYFLGLPTDCESRQGALQDYHSHRTQALRRFSALTEPNEAQPLTLPGLPFQGEAVICAVQLALLEALGKNMQSCHTYLDRGITLMLDLESHTDHSNSTGSLHIPDCSPLQPDQLSTPRPTPLSLSPPSHELRALHFFTSLLVYNDILSSSVLKTPPSSAATYRRLLSDPSYARAMQTATGCQSWVLLSIMDATALEKWKAEQERQGNLSIRDLVSRAAEIEAAVEEKIALFQVQQQSSVHHPTASANDRGDTAQTTIFAHALLIYIHTIVSGSLSGVPEVRRSIDRTVRAWESIQGSGRTRPLLKTLAWPYCVSASLASGTQRDFFRGLVSDLVRLPWGGLGMGGVYEFKAAVEACWEEEGGRGLGSDRAAAVDWRDKMRWLNTAVLFL